MSTEMAVFPVLPNRFLGHLPIGGGIKASLHLLALLKAYLHKIPGYR
jgi:hypothetical protein